jgi:hypothetical protein
MEAVYSWKILAPTYQNVFFICALFTESISSPNARLQSLLCKKLLLRNPKTLKPDPNWQTLLRKVMAQKGAVLRMMMIKIMISSSDYVMSNGRMINEKFCNVYEWLQTGFGLVIGFIEYLHIITTSNYNANANSHNLQFTTARIKSFQVAVSSPVVTW